MSYGHAVIRSLEYMESIVASNPRLEWDGWDVVRPSRKASSFMNPRARLINGKWVSVSRVSPNSKGYVIPKFWIDEAEK